MILKISVVIPVFNSDESLRPLVERCIATIVGMKGTAEIILVDDASKNKMSWSICQELSAKPEVKAVQLSRNFGKAGAVLCGFHECTGDYVITIDDDLQHAPEDIKVLFDSLGEADVVIAKFRNKKHSSFKKLTSRWKSWLDKKLIGRPKGIKNGPYKLYRKAIVDAMISIKSVNPFIAALLFYVTDNVINVDVDHHARVGGVSQFTTKKRFNSFWNLVFNNSSALLKMITIIGITLSSLSFVAGIYFFIRKLLIQDVMSGFTTTIIVILFSSGLILLSVGVLGEYLARTISLAENKPSFIVKKKIGE